MSYDVDDGWSNWAANFLCSSDQKLVVIGIMISSYVDFYRIGEGNPNSWWFYSLKKLMVAVSVNGDIGCDKRLNIVTVIAERREVEGLWAAEVRVKRL